MSDEQTTDAVAVTPAMSEAGKRAWVAWCDDGNSTHEEAHWNVIYRAMELARREECANAELRRPLDARSDSALGGVCRCVGPPFSSILSIWRKLSTGQE